MRRKRLNGALWLMANDTERALGTGRVTVVRFRGDSVDDRLVDWQKYDPIGKAYGARSNRMTTASIPELRKAHTRTRAQLARAAVRYGKRALARRGSGEDGPPSDQEVARLGELLAAAEAMTAAAGSTGSPPTGNPSNSPGPVSPEPTPIHCRGCGGRRSGWTRPRPLGIRRRPSRLGRHCRRRRSPPANVDRTGGVRAGKAADDVGNRVKGTRGSPGFRMKMTELRAHNVGTGVMVDEREARSRQGNGNGNGNVGTRRVFWCPVLVVLPTEKRRPL